MREIPLTKGKVAIVDDEFYEQLTAMGQWCCDTNGYAIRRVTVNGKKKTTLMHRLVMELAGNESCCEVDHRDGNRSDNRLTNLRAATHQQNCWNQGVGKANKSGYKGVSWLRDRQKWYASIRIDGRSVNLGTYDKVEDAANAYDRVAAKHHGSFARLNHQTVEPSPITSTTPVFSSARLQINNPSGYKGVTWHNEKWRARLVQKHLGYFDNKEDAARAYDVAAFQHFGESAYLNVLTIEEANEIVNHNHALAA